MGLVSLIGCLSVTDAGVQHVCAHAQACGCQRRRAQEQPVSANSLLARVNIHLRLDTISPLLSPKPFYCKIHSNLLARLIVRIVQC